MRNAMLILMVGLLAVMLGCESSGVGIRGDWTGTVDYADEATTDQTMEWAIFDRPAFSGVGGETLRVLVVLSDAECEVTIDYGLLRPDETGTFTFPILETFPTECFPELALLDLLPGNSLELVTTGTFDNATETAMGTFVLRTVDANGEVTGIIRDGTWTATEDP